MKDNINPLPDHPAKIVDRRKKNIKLGDILRLSKRNMSYREIGLILGCTKQSIGKRLRDWENGKIRKTRDVRQCLKSSCPYAERLKQLNDNQTNTEEIKTHEKR